MPVFDRVLPYFTRLEKFSVSASEVSIDLFRLLPPCVRHVRIQAFNHLASFYYSGRLIECLEDPVSSSLIS